MKGFTVNHSPFKKVSADLGINGTQRVIQEVDVCVLIYGPDQTHTAPSDAPSWHTVGFLISTGTALEMPLKQQSLYYVSFTPNVFIFFIMIPFNWLEYNLHHSGFTFFLNVIIVFGVSCRVG